MTMGSPPDSGAESVPASKCPVSHDRSSSSTSWNPMNWIRSGPRSEAKAADELPGSEGACPVKHGGDSSAPPFLPSSLEESARHAQTPLHDQRIPLSTHRMISSIPRADELRPSEENKPKHAPHQPAEEAKWVYPSEQQFYNAMRRKGWEADESTIPTVVRIHNAVNERGWSEVRKWERELHNNPDPRLVRFLGRPQDTSPKAWFNSNVLFYNPPFDRHDWYIDRGDGKEPRRYVIDFYNGDEGSTTGGRGIADTLLRKFSSTEENDEMSALPPRPPSLYLDVRPALDNPEDLKDRVHMFFRDAFPGLFAAFSGPKSSVSQSQEASGPASHTDMERNGGAAK